MKVFTGLALVVVSLLLGALLGYRFGLRADGEGAGKAADLEEGIVERELVVEAGTVPVVEVVAEESVERRGFEDLVRQAWGYESNLRKAWEIERLFEGMTPADAPALLERMLEWPNARERRGMLRPFFVKWGELDGPEALRAAEGLLGRDKTDALSASYAGWAKKDPYTAWEKAADFLEDASPYSAYSLRGVISELAKVDMDAALAVVAGESNDIKAGALSHSMLEGVFESERVAEFVEKVSGLEDMDTKKKLLNSIFMRWGEDDSGDPIAAIGQIGDVELASGAMSGFLAGWANEDREGALRYALENREDPLIAASLGSMLSNAVLRGGKRENAQLLAEVESAGILDEVARELMNGSSFMNPRFALEVAERVSDANERARYQQMAMGSLVRSDLAGAISYFEEKIPMADKGKLLPSISWQLESSAEGGEQLVGLFQQVPEGKDRANAVEALLGRALSPQAKSSESYLSSLEAIAMEVEGLSEKALKNREKLFGPEG